MRTRYLALAGWLLADIGLALAFIGMGDAVRPQPAPRPPVTTPVPCQPGIQPDRNLLTIDLSGLPQAEPGRLEPPQVFVDAVVRQARAGLDGLGLSGQTVGLIQTFTNLDRDDREVPTSLWVNVALLTLGEATALGPALPEDDINADLRVRHFIGDNAEGTAQVEWFLVKECL